MEHKAGFNPFHQFELIELFKIKFFGFEISFTNSALSALICLTIFVVLYFMSKIKTTAFVPNKIMVVMETIFNAVNSMINETIGEHRTSFHQKLIFSIFTFILLANIVGLFPFCFAFTSHIIITLAMAMIVFFVCIGGSVIKHKMKVLQIFIPKGTPIVMMPLMLVLEMFSYLARPFSLSMRLAANMLAGHVILDIIAYFTIMLGIFGIVPFLFMLAMQIFEIAVALLQAYIFSILACVYISDSVHH